MRRGAKASAPWRVSYGHRQVLDVGSAGGDRDRRAGDRRLQQRVARRGEAVAGHAREARFREQPLGDGAAPDAGPASPSIGAFAVYATEAIEMNGGALVTGCSVGVENTTGPFLGGGAAAYFNSGADPCAYGYECNLNNVCVVNHRCERGYIYCDGSCIVGTGACP